MNEQRAREAEMRRRQLVAKIHLQRAQFGAQLEPVGRAMETADAGIRIVQRVRRHPGWVAGLAGVVLLGGLVPGLRRLLGR
ncbi:YqjK family protein [Noviherbaspirillum aridicola]|uniref:DUF3618 domain-containing protein n=1 Tax=Noviherbaspirillum aridicola TaxID=2849687 RepID=A0ABQ4Q844_9BURK|nr:YqjK family protein [Noviherbaspirillum aridicola]GIZ52945.1 hypothetical protein NCCP691_29590 [Noviherbaspirillum aridicola]